MATHTSIYTYGGSNPTLPSLSREGRLALNYPSSLEYRSLDRDHVLLQNADCQNFRMGSVALAAAKWMAGEATGLLAL